MVCQRFRGRHRRRQLGPHGTRWNSRCVHYAGITRAVERPLAHARFDAAELARNHPARIHLAACRSAPKSDVSAGVCAAGRRRDFSVALAPVSHRCRQCDRRGGCGLRPDTRIAVVRERDCRQRYMAGLAVRQSTRSRAVLLRRLLCAPQLRDRPAGNLRDSAVRVRRGGRIHRRDFRTFEYGYRHGADRGRTGPEDVGRSDRTAAVAGTSGRSIYHARSRVQCARDHLPGRRRITPGRP